MYAIRSYYDEIVRFERFGEVVYDTEGLLKRLPDNFPFGGDQDDGDVLHPRLGPQGLVITSYSIHYTKLYEVLLFLRQVENLGDNLFRIADSFLDLAESLARITRQPGLILNGSGFLFQRGGYFAGLGLNRLDDSGNLRITSYNVCYTKLLRSGSALFPLSSE